MLSPAKRVRFSSRDEGTGTRSVRFSDRDEVIEYSPYSTPPSTAPGSPTEGFDISRLGDSPVDESSPFFGGGMMRLALEGEGMLRIGRRAR
jgi:hypothetical protein